MIAEGLEKRMTFRRVMKQTIEKVMANRDVQGVRIKLSGRLGGADMARREELKKGRIPLQTLRADIDFARVTARLAIWSDWYQGLDLPGDKSLVIARQARRQLQLAANHVTSAPSSAT
jgi:hypothetical protein